MDARFDQAKAHFLQGLAAYQAGDFAGAERACLASLALLPGRPSTLTNLGAARLRLGRPQDAVAPLREALASEPDNAEALGHLATALAELGQPAAALEAVTRATALDPGAGAAWMLRGTLLRELGRAPEAATAYRQAGALGADPALVRYCLAALGAAENDAAPLSPPPGYVEQLFDAYAGDFDDHLVQALGYRAPEILVTGLARTDGARYASALDLGCGTGLCAPLLRPRAVRLEGVDLSAQMVAQARARGLYDAVVQADVAAHLAACAPGTHDLLIAADVFIYVGALDGVFAGAQRALQPGGTFCFSVEDAADGDDVALRMSLRYAHSERYIRMLAGKHGFDVRDVARHALRIDQGRPVAGLFAWLVHCGHAA